MKWLKYIDHCFANKVSILSNFTNVRVLHTFKGLVTCTFFSILSNFANTRFPCFQTC